MARVVDADVQGIIETDSSISLTPFITQANLLTTYVDEQDDDGVLSDAELKEIERWLAAYYYAIRDGQPQSKSTGGASMTFQGKTGKGPFELNHWGIAAMGADVSGTLAKLNQQGLEGKKRARIDWGGLAPSDQTDYIDRD